MPDLTCRYCGKPLDGELLLVAFVADYTKPGAGAVRVHKDCFKKDGGRHPAQIVSEATREEE